MNRTQANAALAALQNDYSLDIRDPLWPAIRLSKSLMAVLQTPQVQQLNLIKQLGPAYLVYPGAMHTRLCHSLGVYYLSWCIVTSLLTRGLGTFLTEEGIRDFLCASLLHDIGHFPYAHSLKELPLREHEKLATDLILQGNELTRALDQGGFNKERICAIIDKDRNTSDPQTLYFRSLLSGALDPDKLDYLTRDAYFTGVPYGKQDYSYIISHLTVTKDGKNALLFQAEGSLEQILFSKYQMYKAVYWHERVRSATSMIKKSLFTCLKDGTLEPEQLYALDDYSFYSLAQGKKQQLSNVLDVTFGKLLPCIMEHPYQKNGVLESHCKDIYRRDDLENALCDKLRKQHPELRRDQIIIDTAEPISFEADIPLVLSDGSTVSFSSHDALFSADVKARFISALRKTRIFAPSYIQKSEMEEALANV